MNIWTTSYLFFQTWIIVQSLLRAHCRRDYCWLNIRRAHDGCDMPTREPENNQIPKPTEKPRGRPRRQGKVYEHLKKSDQESTYQNPGSSCRKPPVRATVAENPDVEDDSTTGTGILADRVSKYSFESIAAKYRLLHNILTPSPSRNYWPFNNASTSRRSLRLLLLQLPQIQRNPVQSREALWQGSLVGIADRSP